MSSLQEMIVDLEPKVDAYNQKYFVGRVKAPVTLKFKYGVAFKVYLNEEGYEELRISCAKSSSECGGLKRRLKRDSNEVDRYVVKLKRGKNEQDAGFFLGLVQEDFAEIDLGYENNGVVFFVFTAKPGAEELHIGRNEAKPKDLRNDSSDEEMDWKPLNSKSDFSHHHSAHDLKG